MIIKSFEINKKKFDNQNFFLIFGENEGLKNEIIQILKKNFKGSIENYDETQIISNNELFYNKLFNQSLFNEKKVVIINRCSEKIHEIIENIIEKKISDVKIILNANILEKKSKLRNLFEKDKKAICIPFYSDTHQTLSAIALSFIKNNKVAISQETLNILVERCRGNRQSLNNELEKIKNYTANKKKINFEEILKLTNLSENYNYSELADSCLSKNFKKTINILNENNFSIEDTVIVIRTFLSKAKRLMKLQEEIKKTQNIDKAILNFKPQIFWKDKIIIKEQINHWPLSKVKNLIKNISETELLIKKNSSHSINILSDFIITQSN